MVVAYSFVRAYVGVPMPVEHIVDALCYRFATPKAGVSMIPL
jgi:hypothetical protein